MEQLLWEGQENWAGSAQGKEHALHVAVCKLQHNRAEEGKGTLLGRQRRKRVEALQ
jgi:hypothetical protein